MCSPFPQFLKPPGLNVPDIIIPDDMISNTSASVVPTGYSLLKPFLNEQQRKACRVLGDGNCLFRALSKALSGVEDYHTHLRKAIAEFEETNQTLFEPIHKTISGTAFNSHVKNIKRLYTWGTTTEITAAATLFQLEIYLATDNYKPGVPTWLLYSPKPASLLTSGRVAILSKYSIEDIQHRCQWIELTHVSSIHFGCIEPLAAHQLSRPILEGSTSTIQSIMSQ